VAAIGIGLRHWTASALLHAALIAGLLWMQWRLPLLPRKPAVMEWDVAFVEPSPPPAAAQPMPPVHEPAPALPPREVPRLSARTPRPASPPADEPQAQDPAPPRMEAPAPAITAPPPQPPQLPYADGAWVGETLARVMNARKQYPLQARRMGVEGKVVIEAVVNQQGRVVEATILISSGSPILDQDALALLRTVPEIKPEKMRLAARTVVQIPVNYVLDR